MRWCKYFLCRKIKIKRIVIFFGNFILSIEMIVNFWSQKLAQTYYQSLEFVKTAHFNHSFLLTLALKTRTCVMTLLIAAWSKFRPSLIKILVPYRLPIDALWIGNRHLYYSRPSAMASLIWGVVRNTDFAFGWCQWCQMVASSSKCTIISVNVLKT